jgi:hypothetical protein
VALAELGDLGALAEGLRALRQSWYAS